MLKLGAMLIIVGFVVLSIGAFLPRKIDPFFKERRFEYYKGNECVGYEYRSFAEPMGFGMLSGFAPREYDKVIIFDD